MTSRNSRARIRTSKSTSRADSAHSIKRDKKEVVFLICEAHAFSRKTLKSEEIFSQEEVETFLRQKPQTRRQSYKLFLLEDRIRFKPKNLAIRSHLHPTVLYKNIKGAFVLEERPKWLILCIAYPSTSKRKVEAFFFPNEESAAQVNELLVQVKNNPKQVIQGVEPIGFVSTGSLRSLSRPSSNMYSDTDGSVSLRPSSDGLPKRDSCEEGDYSDSETIGNIRSQATSPIVYPLLLSNSPIMIREEAEMERKYKQVNKEFMHFAQAEYAPKLHNHVLQPGEEPDTNHILTKRSNQTLMTLADELPGSLIFINNTPSKGVHVSDDGPVYMFCQVEQ